MAESQKSKTTVVLIYPGAAKGLNSQAQQFIGSREFPANFRFLLDPDYKFTKAYGLRWDAPKETAHPSSFVIDREGKVVFAQISKSHGGHVAVNSLLKIPPTGLAPVESGLCILNSAGVLK